MIAQKNLACEPMRGTIVEGTNGWIMKVEGQREGVQGHPIRFAEGCEEPVKVVASDAATKVFPIEYHRERGGKKEKPISDPVLCRSSSKPVAKRNRGKVRQRYKASSKKTQKS